MFYLNKISSLLDDFDTTKLEGTTEPEAAPKKPLDLGILSSVAGAGSAAAKGAADNFVGVASTISSLLGDAHDDESEQAAQKHEQEPQKLTQVEVVVPHHQLAPAAFAVQQEALPLPHEVAEGRPATVIAPHLLAPLAPVAEHQNGNASVQVSPAPSSRDFSAEGWSLEERPESPQESRPSRHAANTLELEAQAEHAVPLSIAKMDTPPATAEAPRQLLEASLGSSWSALPGQRSPASIGTSVSTSGAGTEEYNRCEESVSTVEVTVGSANASESLEASGSVVQDTSRQPPVVDSSASEVVVGSASAIERPQAPGSVVQDSSRQPPVVDFSASEVVALRLRIARLEAEGANLHTSNEAQLQSAVGQLERLQLRIGELELEVSGKATQAVEADDRFREQAALSQRLSEELDAKKASDKSYQQEVQKLRSEIAEAGRRARAAADQENNSTMGKVRQEMEEELGQMLKQKDDQVRSLEAKLASGEKARRDLSRDLERHLSEVQALQSQVDLLQKDGAGRLSDLQRKISDLTGDHGKTVEELQKRAEIEERQKHELALNLRSVEDRCLAEINQLEAQKAQLEISFGALQVQLQEEQRKVVDLSEAVGEAQQRISQLEGSSAGGLTEEVRAAVEMEVRDVRERLRAAEEKLLDAQSMRDMFAKETDMYRAELKVAREERVRLEGDLAKAQERLRTAAAATSGPGAAGGQQAVVEALQKDFDSRVERYRDEVQYLRQKCDEKERRLEQLLAERSSLAAELRTSRSEDVTDLEAGSKPSASTKPAGGSRGSLRTLPLSAPAWLRNSDEPLRIVVRTLSTHPEARLIFFAYVVLMHAWNHCVPVSHTECSTAPTESARLVSFSACAHLGSCHRTAFECQPT